MTSNSPTFIIRPPHQPQDKTLPWQTPNNACETSIWDDSENQDEATLWETLSSDNQSIPKMLHFDGADDDLDFFTPCDDVCAKKNQNDDKIDINDIEINVNDTIENNSPTSCDNEDVNNEMILRLYSQVMKLQQQMKDIMQKRGINKQQQNKSNKRQHQTTPLHKTKSHLVHPLNDIKNIKNETSKEDISWTVTPLKQHTSTNHTAVNIKEIFACINEGHSEDDECTFEFTDENNNSLTAQNLNNISNKEHHNKNNESISKNIKNNNESNKNNITDIDSVHQDIADMSNIEDRHTGDAEWQLDMKVVNSTFKYPLHSTVLKVCDDDDEEDDVLDVSKISCTNDHVSNLDELEQNEVKSHKTNMSYNERRKLKHKKKTFEVLSASKYYTTERYHSVKNSHKIMRQIAILNLLAGREEAEMTRDDIKCVGRNSCFKDSLVTGCSGDVKKLLASLKKLSNKNLKQNSTNEQQLKPQISTHQLTQPSKTSSNTNKSNTKTRIHRRPSAENMKKMRLVHLGVI